MASSAVDLSKTIAQIRDSEPTSVPEQFDVALVDASQLCGILGEQWKLIRDADEQFSSPYFDIEFTKAVARVRKDVEIAVLQRPNDHGICGFLPFQRIGGSHGQPVGGRLNDVHGLLGKTRNELDLFRKVMKSCGLKTFGFHASTIRGNGMERFKFADLDSYFIDLGQGWQEYETWSQNNSSAIKRQGQKTRALQKAHGQIRLEYDCTDVDVLERLIELKRSKYNRSRTFDILSVDWAANLLRELSSVNNEDFKGLLSALWAGDELVAVHFGMLSGNVLHYWFPTFDIEFAKYSPGTELIMRIANEASKQGVTKIDFGYGDDPYKLRFCNGREMLSCGQLNFSKVGLALAKSRYHVRNRLKQIPFKPLAKKILRGTFPGFGQWNFK